MNNYLRLGISLLILETNSYACSDVFIQKGGYHIEARTLDFLVNIAFQDKIGRVGEDDVTQVILDQDKIPSPQIMRWKNKYGYFGRAAFDRKYMVDGMNTEGMSVSILYLKGTKFPVYNPKDKRPVLGVYDIASYVLSQAATTREALDLLKSIQIVRAAAACQKDVFIKDIPIHYVIRDKQGASAVIEFTDGKVRVYKDAGNVLTNNPPFLWQKENAKHYDALKADAKAPNSSFLHRVYNYLAIYKSAAEKGEANLLGTPGDFTPASRFARAKILLNNFPDPQSHSEALYQAQMCLNSLSVPAVKGASPTLWVSIKDLDKGVYYVKNIGDFNKKHKFSPFGITTEYLLFDLKSINFKLSKKDRKKPPEAPLDLKKIKIISVDKAASLNP